LSRNACCRSLLGLILLALVSACSTMPSPGGDDGRNGRYQARIQQLKSQDSWEMEGRLAVNDGRDGGSGRFKWVQQPGSTHMDFHGALGRGAWRLDADGHGATLEFANGEVARSGSINQLAKKQLGWQIPVNALEWWVRGIEAPGGSPLREIDEHGALLKLHQFGWKIEYERYNDSDKFMLPYRMTARRQDQTVKLAVRRWFLSVSGNDPE
jgi:outer membrane lipoprotein LolB